jgi:hypothetical protein
MAGALVLLEVNDGVQRRTLRYHYYTAYRQAAAFLECRDRELAALRCKLELKPFLQRTGPSSG